MLGLVGCQDPKVPQTQRELGQRRQTIVPADCAARPCILLVDDDRDGDMELNWGAALTAAGVTFTTSTPLTYSATCATDAAPGDVQALAGWDLVFWQTGEEAYTNFSAQNEADAIAYLTAAPGGRLVLAGMHVTFDEVPAGNLLTGYMGISSYGGSANMPLTPFDLTGAGDEIGGTATYTLNTLTTDPALCWNDMSSIWTPANGGTPSLQDAAGKSLVSKKEDLSATPYRTMILGFHPDQFTLPDTHGIVARSIQWLFRPYAATTSGPFACAPGQTCGLIASAQDVTGLTLTYEWDVDDDGLFGEAGEPVGATTSHVFPSSGIYPVAVRISNDYSSIVVSTTVTVEAFVVITTPPQTVVAGACSAPVDVELRDASGVAMPAPSSITVTLASDGPSGGFFSDPGCTAGISSVSILLGSSSATFFYADTTVGTPTITVDSPPFTPSNQLWTITPSTADRLEVTTAPQLLVAGSCSAPVDLQIQDVWGNPATLSADASLALTSDSPTLVYFSDPGCNTVITSLLILGGTSMVQIWFMETTAGTPSVEGTVLAITSAFQVQTIVSGPPDQLRFTSPPHTVVVTGCSPPVVVEVLDTSGNQTPVVTNTDITLTADSVTMTVYSDPGCSLASPVATILTGGTTATFYVADPTLGLVTLTASEPALGFALQAHTIRAGAAVALVISGLPSTVTAGDVSNLIVSAVDVQGNVDPDYLGTIEITTTDTAALLPANRLFTAADAGVVTVSGLSLRTAGFQDVFARDTAFATIDGVVLGVLVVAGPPADMLVVAAPTGTAGIGVLISVQLIDAFGNLAAGPAEVCFVASGDAGGAPAIGAGTLAVTSQPDPQNLCGSVANDGSGSVLLTDTSAETVTITISLSGGTNAPTVIAVDIGPGTPVGVRLTPDDGTALACQSELVTLQVVDDFGNPVTDPTVARIEVTLSVVSIASNPRILSTTLTGATPGGANVTGTTSATGGGTVTVALDGAAPLDLTCATAALLGPATQTIIDFTRGVVDASVSGLTVDTPQVDAGAGAATLTATPRDACGVGMGSGLTVDFTATFGVVSTPAADNGDGTYTSVFSTAPGKCPDWPAVIEATADGTRFDTAVEVTARCTAVDPTTSPSPTSGTTEACPAGEVWFTVSVRPLDTSGFGLPPDVVFTATDPDGWVKVGPVQSSPNGDGSTTHIVSIGSDRCGFDPALDTVMPTPVTLLVDGVPLTTTIDILFTCPAIDPAMGFTADPSTVPADGSSPAHVRLEVRDVCGNPVFGRQVTFLPSRDDLGIVLSNAVGMTIDLPRDATDGTVEVSLSADRAGTTGLVVEVQGVIGTSQDRLVTFVLGEVLTVAYASPTVRGVPGQEVELVATLTSSYSGVIEEVILETTHSGLDILGVDGAEDLGDGRLRLTNVSGGETVRIRAVLALQSPPATSALVARYTTGAANGERNRTSSDMVIIVIYRARTYAAGCECGAARGTSPLEALAWVALLLGLRAVHRRS